LVPIKVAPIIEEKSFHIILSGSEILATANLLIIVKEINLKLPFLGFGSVSTTLCSISLHDERKDKPIIV